MRTNGAFRIEAVMVALAVALTGIGCHLASRRSAPAGVTQPVPLVGRITAIGHRSRSAISLACPPEVSSDGDVLVHTAYAGDERTYWDNNGILDEALNVTFIRRDRPGMIAIAKIDPAAHMLPNAPLPGRPSDEKLDNSTAQIVAQQSFNLLSYGRQHPGAADYFVLGAFSDACAAPVRMRITDPRGPMPVEPDDLNLKTAATGGETPPERRGVVARLAWLEGQVAVVGAFRVAADSAGEPAPFASIVIAYLRPTGGVILGQVWVPHVRERDDLVGSFQVPVTSLLTTEGVSTPGKYALFAFVGNEAAPVRVFKVE